MSSDALPANLRKSFLCYDQQLKYLFRIQEYANSKLQIDFYILSNICVSYL